MRMMLSMPVSFGRIASTSICAGTRSASSNTKTRSKRGSRLHRCWFLSWTQECKGYYRNWCARTPSATRPNARTCLMKTVRRRSELPCNGKISTRTRRITHVPDQNCTGCRGSNLEPSSAFSATLSWKGCPTSRRSPGWCASKRWQ